MMETLCFSVFDDGVHAYLPPFFCRSRAEAIRSFREACEDEKHQFHRHAKDYRLFQLGMFEDASGQLVGRAAGPDFVISATDCLVAK